MLIKKITTVTEQFVLHSRDVGQAADAAGATGCDQGAPLPAASGITSGVAAGVSHQRAQGDRNR